MSRDAQNVCPICGKHLRKNDGPIYTRHLAKCRAKRFLGRVEKKRILKVLHQKGGA